MRPEELYLRDIVNSADDVAEFLKDFSFERFAVDKRTCSAVLQKMIVIGEAAAQLPQECKEHYPHVPWKRITAFRNFAVHAYFGVDWKIVWGAATQNTPELRRMVEEILQRDFPIS